MSGDLTAEARAIASSSPKIRAYALDQAQQFEALQAQVAALTTSRDGEAVDPRPYGFEPYANGANADVAVANLLGDLAGTPESLTVEFPPGFYTTSQFHDWGVVGGLRLLGKGGNPAQLDAQPNPRARTTFATTGTAGTPLFGQGWGGVLKAGVVCEHIDFFNTRRDFTGDAVLMGSVNDWGYLHCGFHYFGTNFHLARGGADGSDNAHGLIFNCFSYESERHMDGEGLFGVTVFGGEIIGHGDREQVGFALGVSGHEARVSCVKGVGLRGGFATVLGGRNTFRDIDVEKCGSPTRPALDFDGRAPLFIGDRAGYYNRAYGVTITGSGNELPPRLGPHSYGCKIEGVIDNMGAHPGLQSDEVLNQGTKNTVDVTS